MKWMRMVAVMTVTAALAFGAAGCAKKTEDTAAQDTAADQGGAARGVVKALQEKAEPAPAQ